MYDIEEAFAAIEEELIASMIRNLERHSAWEEKEGFQWEQWQALQLQSLEQYKKRNKKKFTKKFNSINQHIETAIREARERGGFDQEIKILEAIKTGKFTARGKKGANAQFFKLNDRKIDALIKATVNDMQKAETAILRMANDQYRQVIFNAQVYANSGAGTYEKAVDMATKGFLSAGLNCVEYKNGARHTLKDYADMALKTASKRAYLTGEGEKRVEWGIHTVIVNKRGNPCPKCLPFVGRVFIDDVWSGGSSKDGKYPLLSSAVEAGLYHPRCKDSHTTFFPEDDLKPVSYSKNELRKIEDDYIGEQEQKRAANNAKKYNRLAEYSLDPENKSVYKAKSTAWEKVSKTTEKVVKEVEQQAFTPAKTVGEARDALSNTIGFRNIDGIDFMDEWLLIENTNQLMRLESKFGAIHKSDFVDIDLDTGKFIGEVSSNRISPTSQYLTLNKKDYSDKDSFIKKESKHVKSGYSMPMSLTDEELSVGNIMHEYGHILQNTIKADYMKSLGWTQSNMFDFVDKKAKTDSAKYKWYIDANKKIQDDCYDEIIAIAKKNNPSFDLDANISDYGKTNKGEFFAEVFMNSQLSKPNELGIAMNEWLKIKGYIKKVSKTTEMVENSAKSSTMMSRNLVGRKMANGLRASPSHILSEAEIKSVVNDAESLDIPIDVLRFNKGNQTGFLDRTRLINIKGDILPDLSSTIPRDCMSQRAVLAHEYYGHFKSHPSRFVVGDWRDEFMASYRAALETPNLSDDERRMLMLDAYDRAKDAGVSVKYNKEARRIIYGYDD